MIMKGIIGVPIPHRFYAPWEFVDSLLKTKMDVVCSSGSLIDENRNNLVKKVLELDIDYLLMIDTDMVFKPEDIEKIEKHLASGLDIVSGFCRRGGDALPAIFKWDKEVGDYQACLVDSSGVIEVEAVGGAFLAISKKVLESIPFPFSFLTINNKWQGEDISFCHRAREKGFKIYCDLDLKIGHLRTIVI